MACALMRFYAWRICRLFAQNLSSPTHMSFLLARPAYETEVEYCLFLKSKANRTSLEQHDLHIDDRFPQWSLYTNLTHLPGFDVGFLTNETPRAHAQEAMKMTERQKSLVCLRIAQHYVKRQHQRILEKTPGACEVLPRLCVLHQ